ncbi:MAG: hypothetical protein H0W72_13455 [Planctomycetes bacterium]|nr:hypothetical protein [Planctomycetota bacterium]
MKTSSAWPVLRRYDSAHLARIAMPVGGIATGSLSLGGRGDLRDWELGNTPNKGFVPNKTMLLLWAQEAGAKPVTRLLEGPLEAWQHEGAFGCPVTNQGWPRFREASFAAAYPFGQVELSDDDVPLEATVQAFNPLIPGDVPASSHPVAVLRVVLRNRGRKPVRASVCANLENFIGNDKNTKGVKANRNRWREEKGLRGIAMETTGVDPKSANWGTLALATTTSGSLSHREAWAELSWGDSLLDFWDDFSADGALEQREQVKEDAPMGSIAVRTVVPPRGERTVTFLIGWCFPNRQTWTPPKDAATTGACVPGACAPGAACDSPSWIGNHYATVAGDAWNALRRFAAELPELERRTIDFVERFCASDLPEVVKEAALANLSTLRTQTCFRTPDGHFFGWEGCGDTGGCCHGSCTHVWNYELATPFVFGELARSMRTVEFAHMTRADGLMAFRVNLPIHRAQEYGMAAADGQMGCIIKLQREWRLSGDEALLRRLWPGARKSLEYCWIPGGWDADQDGVMEGCQHNTMDVEYYGPNPQMGFWYLGALRAAEDMARHLGETEFAERCRALFTRGSAWMDKHLFNGDYYEHEIRPMKREDIAPGLIIGMGGDTLDPVLQLGAGCLVDQLVGQVMARVNGLGDLGDAKKLAKAARAVHTHNFKRGLADHFNHLRGFALADESALLMASYPRGRRPKRPFPYYNEVMTGFEYVAALAMLQLGSVDQGLECIEAIRARYDGLRRSPFDEAECGHHYARAMASWGAVVILSGFQYDAVVGSFTVAAKPRASWFWSTGDAWGTVRQRKAGRGVAVEIEVAEGELRLARVELDGFGAIALPQRTLRAGKILKVTVAKAGTARTKAR